LGTTTTGTGTTGTGTTGTTTTTAPSSSNFGSSITSSPHGVATASISGTQLLYDFNQTPDKFRAAKRNVESFRASEKTTELSVLLSVRQAFFTAREDKALVYVAQETLQNETKHVTQVRGFVAAGTQPEIALATELTNFGNDRVALITAQNNYEIAKAQLNQAAGLVGGTDYDVGDETVPPLGDEDQPLDVLARKGLAARPEMIVLARQREAQEATLGSARGGYGPTIAAAGGVTDYGVALDQLVRRQAELRFAPTGDVADRI